MAQVVVTLRIMPESPELDLKLLEKSILNEIKQFSGETEVRSTKEPVAFGLNSLNILFVMDEAKGTTDPLEKKISAIAGVNSVEVIDVRRAVG